MGWNLRSDMSLSWWQSHLDSFYGDVNSKRQVLETFARVTEMATGISRGVREENKEILEKFMPRFLAWILGLASQLNIDLEKAVWDNYPGVCPYCRKDINCSCKISKDYTNRLSDGDEVKKYQLVYQKPENLVEWVGMYSRIYGQINKNTGKMKMLSHFLEELGELSEIIRFNIVAEEDLVKWNVALSKSEIKQNLDQEISDLFSWFCGLADILGVEIDYFMKGNYGAVCPECASKPCDCDPYYVHKKLRLGSKKGGVL